MKSVLRHPVSRRAIAIRWLAPALLILSTAQEGMASFISITPPSSTLAPGASETISVAFTSTQDFTLQSTSFALVFDTTRFSANVASFRPGNLISGSSSFTLDPFGHIWGGSTLPAGGNPLTAGQFGTLMTFTLTALANAPAGSGQINLLASFNIGTNITTGINGGAITLSPAPTDGFDPAIDATVTVTAGAVPEPSSLALCGLGGLAALGYASRRRGRRSAV